MAQPKTRPTQQSVESFLSTVSDEQKHRDCLTIDEMMRQATGEAGRMWGESIVGYGLYSYKYASGHSGEWPVVAFSPRKANLTLYIMSGFDQNDELLSRLGKYKTGKSCLYIKKLADVDQEVLNELITRSVVHMKETNPGPEA